MGVHVEGQVVDLVEGLVADGAFVLLLAAVGELVVLVVPYRRAKTKTKKERVVVEGVVPAWVQLPPLAPCRGSEGAA